MAAASRTLGDPSAPALGAIMARLHVARTDTKGPPAGSEYGQRWWVAHEWSTGVQIFLLVQ